MDNKYWFDPIHDGCKHIRECAYQLTDLSEAFSRTGNDNMAQEITAIANTITKAQDEIYHAIGKHINDEFHQSEQASLNILKTALTVATQRG